MQAAKTMVLLLSLTYLAGCTKKFDEYNTNPSKLLNLTSAEFPYLFSRAQSSASFVNWRYQYAQNWFADLFSQYFSITETYIPNDRYAYSPGDLGQHWRIYTDVVPQLKTLLDEVDSTNAEHALAKIWWVYVFHRTTDYYGPIPYFKAGIPAESVPYDPQDQIYDDFFKKLDEADAVLRANTGKIPYGPFDLIYAGDVAKWLKFTNTLRLRLAMRISKANPDKAKIEAEKAFSNGVMTDIADDALMAKTELGGDLNGLSAIAVWNEFRMSASMESVMKGYDDPRIGVFFQPADGTGDFDGLRNGLLASEQILDPNKAINNSNIGLRWVEGSGSNWTSKVAAQNILHTAEAFFLRAEGALNGWEMGGTAQELYEAGIRASMHQWGITDETAIDTYISSTATPVAPNDYFNSPAMNDYPVLWSSDPAMQRKQLAQQKWLALYPDGMEAWADLRRSKEQQLYPVVHSDNSDIPQGQFIKRMPFLDQEKLTNAGEVLNATQYLDGPDKPTTPLWWDK